ncbi:hypothetical protein PIB30_078592 [Stylosanthes scabra]|uniref:F-box domain-containing protein n=1 Tax=Stylosanthes scabra TaxID=79078 RepID=A0ABU6RR61_9FABA|nr:hypothetical protein [Stylosanthes scabra]
MEPPPPPTQRRQLPHLPEDVVMLILSFLPVKSLMQFMCVCRSWNSLITSPKFAKLKYLRTPKYASIILTVDDTLDPDMTIIHAAPCSVPSLLSLPLSAVSEDSFIPIMDDYYVVGTCHGLVCLAGSVWESEGESWVKFWNPETRITSERSPSLHFNSDLTVALNYGFGYDCENDVYKIVALISDSEKARVKDFTMADSCWRDMGSLSFPALPIAGSITNENDGIYINGTLNWLALCNFSGENAWEEVTAVDQLVILSLDLGKETYNQFGLPVGLDELPKLKPVLGVLRDCLYLCHDYKTSHFVLWQMKEFGNAGSWTPLLNVSHQHLQIERVFEPEHHPIVPMCMS